MDWSEIESGWADWRDRILAHLPEIGADRMARLGGDRGAFAGLLADTYDLTLSEAGEAIDMLLLRLSGEYAA